MPIVIQIVTIHCFIGSEVKSKAVNSLTPKHWITMTIQLVQVSVTAMVKPLSYSSMVKQTVEPIYRKLHIFHR